MSFNELTVSSAEVLGEMSLCCNSDLNAHLKVDVSPAVSHGGQSDHSSSPSLFQTLQQQAGQQEVTQVVHPKLDAKTIFCPAVSHQTCGKDRDLHWKIVLDMSAVLSVIKTVVCVPLYLNLNPTVCQIPFTFFKCHK